MISNMGSANGSPGRLVETDANYNIIGEYPMDLNGLTHTGDATARQFSPHGLCLNAAKNIMLSSDFGVPNSLLKPSTAV
jgi:selenium-binding protein 1